jgi:hypothetical protein
MICGSSPSTLRLSSPRAAGVRLLAPPNIDPSLERAVAVLCPAGVVNAALVAPSESLTAELLPLTLRKEVPES